jgi:hypothetical protein
MPVGAFVCTTVPAVDGVRPKRDKTIIQNLLRSVGDKSGFDLFDRIINHPQIFKVFFTHRYMLGALGISKIQASAKPTVVITFVAMRTGVKKMQVHQSDIDQDQQDY